MTTATSALTIDQVSVGDQLPPLAYDVTATTVVTGAIAARDIRPQHHDYEFVTTRNGLKNIFLNSPNQLAWLERFLTDWTGPKGRPGRISFKMLDSIFPGDTMVFSGVVTAADVDETGCGWVGVDITVKVGDRLCTTCTARIAIPVTPDDNPWSRRGETWIP